MRHPRRNRTARAAARPLAIALLTGGLLAGAGPAAAHATAAGAAAPAPCTYTRLVAEGAQRDASGRVRVTVVNDGAKPCVLRGFPTVALAGQGSPDRNKPLAVVRQGEARPVQLAAGGRATTLLTFTPVLGEADGYCASGAEPTVAPSLVVGVGGGALQSAPADGGDLALCGGSVRATAFR